MCRGIRSTIEHVERLTCVRRHSCFPWSQKTAKLQTKISAIPRAMTSKVCIPMTSPRFIQRTSWKHMIYTKNTGTIETPKLLSRVATGLSLLYLNYLTLQNAVESTERSGMSERSSFGQGLLLPWWPVISPAPAWGHREIKLQRATGNARPFPVTEQNDVVEL